MQLIFIDDLVNNPIVPFNNFPDFWVVYFFSNFIDFWLSFQNLGAVTVFYPLAISHIA